MKSWMRPIGAGLRALLVLTVILGIVYPLAMTGFAQVAFPGQANGSLLRHDGRVVGSELLGQNAYGPRWFHPRPSAAGYDASASGASNLGPNNPELRKQIAERRAAIAKENRVAPGRVPPDALTASGSGLDPDISPAYAKIQIDRVARANGLTPAVVAKLVREKTSGRDAGLIGDPRVNVLELNIAVATHNE